MSITLKTITVAAVSPPGKTLFAISGYSADLQGCEIIKAAPTSGAIYIENIHAAIALAGTVDIGSGKSDSAVETVALQLVGSANGLVHPVKPKRPIRLVSKKALTIDASTSGNVSILVEGFVAPAE